jgi:hypothetical protein
MPAVRYISDTEEIIKASWWILQYDSTAEFKLSAKSPLPPPLSPNNVPGGQTHVLNVSQITTITCHCPAEIYENSTPESISITENQLDLNHDLNYPNQSNDH